MKSLAIFTIIFFSLVAILGLIAIPAITVWDLFKVELTKSLYAGLLFIILFAIEIITLQLKVLSLESRLRRLEQKGNPGNTGSPA